MQTRFFLYQACVGITGKDAYSSSHVLKQTCCSCVKCFCFVSFLWFSLTRHGCYVQLSWLVRENGRCGLVWETGYGQSVQQRGLKSPSKGCGLHQLHPCVCPDRFLWRCGKEVHLWPSKNFLPVCDLWPSLHHSALDHWAQCRFACYTSKHTK